MNRQERRNNQRLRDKLQSKVDKMDNTQAIIVEKLAQKLFDDAITEMLPVINDAVFSAMRENRVGEERAYRILEVADKYIAEEGKCRRGGIKSNS
jgi:hypothetical protein